MITRTVLSLLGSRASLGLFAITALFFPFQGNYASELVKGEIDFRVGHSIKPVRGLCKDIFIEQLRLKQGKDLALASPFVVICDVGQMDTENKGRDQDMRKALRYPEYKKVTLEVRDIEKQKNKYKISGILTIGGVKRNYSSLATITRVSRQVNAKGRFSLKLSDFDIKRPSYLFFEVRDTIEIKYHFIVNVGSTQ